MMHFATGPRHEADALVKRWHYSHRTPSNVIVVGTWHVDGGLFGDSGEMVAACYFAIPASRWSEPVVELARLVRAERPDVEPLSGLISQTCRHIRQHGLADLLVSFADSTQGHHGGVYQAASWNYHGQRDRRMDGCFIAGRFVTGRGLNHRYGTQSVEKLRAMGVDAEPHYDEGKHLYWRAINKPGQRKAGRLGLRSEPYPRPDEVSDMAQNAVDVGTDRAVTAA